ncbi:MAG: hypothetical protein ACRDKT_04570 [Actinomycetota bacterium]
MAIEQLLERRATAIVERDRDAFMATISNASPAFRARQAQSFRRLSGIPLASFRYTVGWDRYGDLARPSDKARYDRADEVVIPVTEERYRIEGFDPEEAVEDTFFTYVKTGDGWLIAEDTDLEDLALFTGRHPWDFGSVVSERSDHFLMLRHTCDACTPRHDYLGLAEDALARAERYWTGPWHKRMVLVVPRNEIELARLIQSTFDLDNFVAFAYSTVDLADGVDYTGHRIILNPAAFEGRSSESMLEILAHELLHVATRDSAGPFVPIFLDEGFADYVGNDADPDALSFFDAEVAAGVFSGVLPLDYEFTVGSGTEIFRSYQESQSAVRFFIQRWGLRDFGRLYRDLGRVRIGPGTARYQIDRALGEVIGLGYEEFERAWADSIR